MRILWLTAGLLPEACKKLGCGAGNGGGWLQSMLDALRKADSALEMCVACMDDRSCDVVIDKVRHVSFGASGGFTYRVIPRDIEDHAKWIIADFAPDVIHVHGTEYFFGRMADATYCGRPVVVSLQGILSQYWVHFTGGISANEIARDNLLNPRAILRGRTIFQEQTKWREERAWQEQEVFRKQRNFIGRTEWDRHCLEYYNPSARYFHVNENLRSPFYFMRRDRKNILPHSIYCAGAASYPLKGAHWLFHAIAALKGDFPDIKLRIAGAEKIMSRPNGFREWIHRQVYYDYLRRLAHELDIERHIVALPSLDAAGVAEELSKAELYCSATLCENSPNSLGEAMLVGTPAIHTCVGGVQSILKDGVEGKLVPPCDSHALAGAIRRWFMHPEEAEACVEPARNTALKRHDAMANAEATLAVYRKLAGNER